MVKFTDLDSERLDTFWAMMNIPKEEIVYAGKEVAAYKTSFDFSIETADKVEVFHSGDYITLDGNTARGLRQSDIEGDVALPCPGCSCTVTRTKSDDKEIDGVLLRRFYTECTLCGWRTGYTFSVDAAKILWSVRNA